jgi:hypothetical protein
LVESVCGTFMVTKHNSHHIITKLSKVVQIEVVIGNTS